MRTLIFSDMHLGNGGSYDAFAGGEVLPALLDSVSVMPTRIVLNGDSVDFLMNDAPLTLDRDQAVREARAIVAAPASAAVFSALGRVLARRGEVVIRLGNHDIELALPEVQEVVRGALEQPPSIAERIRFSSGENPEIIEVGGVPVLVTHGEHVDPWNRVDYKNLTGEGGSLSRFTYAAGSILVKQFLNRLKKDYGMRFADLLKPDFHGGLLTALAIAPDAVKLIFQDSSFRVLWQLFRQAGAALPFDEQSAEVDLGLSDRMSAAMLSEHEQQALRMMMGDVPLSFDDTLEAETIEAVRLKLARAGLKLYVGLQRSLTGKEGDEYFRLDPDASEWDEAQRLAKKYSARAVVLGHTHAARWKASPDLVFANTGTWIWLMKLPPYASGDDVWVEFIEELRDNPRLLPAQQKLARLRARLTMVSIEENTEAGADMSLQEVKHEGVILDLGTTTIRPA